MFAVPSNTVQRFKAKLLRAYLSTISLVRKSPLINQRGKVIAIVRCLILSLVSGLPTMSYWPVIKFFKMEIRSSECGWPTITAEYINVKDCKGFLTKRIPGYMEETFEKVITSKKRKRLLKLSAEKIRELEKARGAKIRRLSTNEHRDETAAIEDHNDQTSHVNSNELQSVEIEQLTAKQKECMYHVSLENSFFSSYHQQGIVDHSSFRN
jgi:hypothetical protein